MSSPKKTVVIFAGDDYVAKIYRFVLNTWGYDVRLADEYAPKELPIADALVVFYGDATVEIQRFYGSPNLTLLIQEDPAELRTALRTICRICRGPHAQAVLRRAA